MNTVQIQRKINEGKISISNNKNGKNGKHGKHEDMRECMKEVTHILLKFVENWADEGSIEGIIDTDRMARRDDSS